VQKRNGERKECEEKEKKKKEMRGDQHIKVVKVRSLLKGNYNIMLLTQNTTSRTLQGSCHMKYTNLCNEEKRAKPSTPRYLTKRPNHK